MKVEDVTKLAVIQRTTPVVSEPCTDLIPYVAPKPVDRSALKLHLGFPCLDCGASLSSQTALNMHQRTHTGEKPYCCLFCSFHSAQSYRVTTHARSKHGHLLQPGAPTYAKKKDLAERGISESLGFARGFNQGRSVALEGVQTKKSRGRYQPYGQHAPLGFDNIHYSEQGRVVGSFPRNPGDPSNGYGPGSYQGRSEYVPVFETYVSLGNPSNQRSGIDLHSANSATCFIGQQDGRFDVHQNGYQIQGCTVAPSPQGYAVVPLKTTGGNFVQQTGGTDVHQNGYQIQGYTVAPSAQGDFPTLANANYDVAPLKTTGGNFVQQTGGIDVHQNGYHVQGASWTNANYDVQALKTTGGNFAQQTGGFDVNQNGYNPEGGWPYAASPDPSSLTDWSASPGPSPSNGVGGFGDSNSQGSVLSQQGQSVGVSAFPDLLNDVVTLDQVVNLIATTMPPYAEQELDLEIFKEFFPNVKTE